MSAAVNVSGSGRVNAAGKRPKPVSKSSKAGVLFPVARLHRYLKRLNPRKRVSMAASVYTAAVMEYLAAEVLELSGNAARDNDRTRVTPRHVFLAVSIDEELKKLLKNVTISQGGNLPYIHPFLLKSKAKIEKEAKISKAIASTADESKTSEVTITSTTAADETVTTVKTITTTTTKKAKVVSKSAKAKAEAIVADEKEKEKEEVAKETAEEASTEKPIVSSRAAKARKSKK